MTENVSGCKDYVDVFPRPNFVSPECPLDGSHFHDSNHGQKSWDTFAFLRRFPMHTVQPLPLPQKQCWTSVSRIFTEFQLCVRWGEKELQENVEKDALF